MTISFHGITTVDLDNMPRNIPLARASVVGIVGTAPDADAAAFPLNTPVLILGSRVAAAKLDTAGNRAGTLPNAMDGIFDNASPLVVVVRVEADADEAQEVANVIGGVTADGQRQGLQALLDAQSKVKVKPRKLIAPGFSHKAAVLTEMDTIAHRLRGMVIADGPNTTDADAISYREQFGSQRIYLVDTWVKVFDADAPNNERIEPASARIAGVWVASDSDAARGFWWSPSNREVRGIIGTDRPVQFQIDDANSQAAFLNSNEVNVIVQEDGFRLFGNRTCSSDAKWAFANHVVLDDILKDSIVAAHLWAVDRNLTKTYFDMVTEGVNNFLSKLIQLEVIAPTLSDGQPTRCYADPDLNTAANLDAGQVWFNVAYARYGVAENIVFRFNVKAADPAELLPQAA